MKLLLFLLLFLQPEPNPVHLSFDSKMIQPGIYQVYMFAQIDHGWHIFTLKDSVYATHITFTPNKMISHLKMEEYGTRDCSLDSPYFKRETFIYNVLFTQKVITKNRLPNTLYGEVLYVVSNGNSYLVKREKFMIALN